jgi:hypothetical protein
MLNKFKLILSLAGILTIVGFCYFGKASYDNYVSMKEKMYTAETNAEVYKNIMKRRIKDNYALTLNIDDLRDSNDKLIHELDSVRKSLKIKGNKPGDVLSVSTTNLTSNIDVKIPDTVKLVDSINIDTTIYPNKDTKYTIKLKKRSLNCNLDINNSQYLYVYSTREYVEDYKGWLDRLIHLDYRKKDVTKYSIVNSNELIKVTDMRVIKGN